MLGSAWSITGRLLIFAAWLFSKDGGLGLWLAWKMDCRLLELSQEASCKERGQLQHCRGGSSGGGHRESP